ncbi:hypothetical protein [Sinomicrobium weinanense]|uniref:DUF2214 family protein n=1 Tax=Sinomicrobium weinanense TaxID=2842200 RepID=A0A926Q3Z0_9FLAO|nr:hypothetical protein [Sinomicrobium weinanense]MBC9798068.1 hypothetical protein [Sinomicrobium weinanense]MBU3122519.1 hypothetical protein [Sinomicrobium weinanense]
MTTMTLYHMALVIHITGLTTMAGITLGNYVMTRQFWKQYAIDKHRGIAIHQTISRLEILIRIGIGLLILSGISMMALTQGVFGEHTWFRTKMGLLLIIIFNDLIVGRRQRSRLKKLLSEGASDQNEQQKLLKIKANINILYMAQITLFLIIFVLSVFKFN